MSTESGGESPLILLVDGDIVAHRVAAAGQKQRYTLHSDPNKIFDSHKEALEYSTGYVEIVKDGRVTAKEEVTKAHIEYDELDNVLNTFDISIEKIQDACLAEFPRELYHTYLIFTGCDKEQNFREAEYPEYKANRHGVAKPKHLPDVIAHAKRTRRCIFTQGFEADDMLGRAAQDAKAKYGDAAQVVFVSYDKDIKQLPGMHYNFVKEDFSEVSEREGIRLFFKQMLIGDTADNVKGVKGIGEKKAEKYLNPAGSDIDWYTQTYKLYKGSGMEHHWTKNCDLLWIWRTVPDSCPYAERPDD